MTPDTFYIYTDASFSKLHQIAIVGHALFQGSYEHEMTPISKVKINTLQIKESNNIRAEIRGALRALESCPKAEKIILYSDCQTIINLPVRRARLELGNYRSKSKNRTLSNADLYREFYRAYDRLLPDLIWVKGHSSSQNQSKIQKNFSYLDQQIRNALRAVV